MTQSSFEKSQTIKLLVTGGTGYIGSSYVRHLVQNHPQVQVYFCGRDMEKGNRLSAFSGAHFFRGDLGDKGFAKSICKDVDAVVHCAGLTGQWGAYETFYQANVVSTDNLLSAAREASVQRFVNLSSSGIYSDYNDHINITEDYLPPRFADNCARTQYQAETRVTRAHSEQLRTLSLRPQIVIGAGPCALLPHLVEKHQQGRLRQIGEGRNIVSMTSLSNMMMAMDCAIFGANHVTGDVYNIADPQPVNLWDEVNGLMAALGLPPVTRKLRYSSAFGLASVNEALQSFRKSNSEPDWLRRKVALMGRSFTLNTEKAKRKLGYTPEYVHSESIIEFVDWWKGQFQRQP